MYCFVILCKVSLLCSALYAKRPYHAVLSLQSVLIIRCFLCKVSLLVPVLYMESRGRVGGPRAIRRSPGFAPRPRAVGSGFKLLSVRAVHRTEQTRRLPRPSCNFSDVLKNLEFCVRVGSAAVAGSLVAAAAAANVTATPLFADSQLGWALAYAASAGHEAGRNYWRGYCAFRGRRSGCRTHAAAGCGKSVANVTATWLLADAQLRARE